MQYVKLGSTGLDVSPIAIGAMTYGEPDRGHPVWSLGKAGARPLIRHALDAGINFFDTANIYSQGSSEEILGHALRDFANRDDIVIATKLRHPMRSGPNGKGLARKEIMIEVEHSAPITSTSIKSIAGIFRRPLKRRSALWTPSCAREKFVTSAQAAWRPGSFPKRLRCKGARLASLRGFRRSRPAGPAVVRAYCLPLALLAIADPVPAGVPAVAAHG